MNIISQYKEPKYQKQLKTEFVSEILFGLNSLKSDKKDLLIITEGITDAISVSAIGIPCLSPVTVRIKNSDVEKMVNYARRYDKVLVINDNEEFSKNNSGLKGSIATIKVLIKHGINCSIGIIPNPEKLEKIDLDDYLKIDLTNVPDNEINTVVENSLEFLGEKLTEINKNSTTGLDFLIDTINEKSTKKELIEILDVLPDNDFFIQEDVFKKLAKKRKITLEAIRKTYTQHQNDKLLKEQKREKLKEEKEGEKEDAEDVFKRIPLNDFDIEIRKDGIFKIEWKKTTKGDIYPVSTKVLNGKFELDFKVFDTFLNIKRFSFRLDGIQYNTLTIMEAITILEANIYGGTHGKDIIKEVFNYSYLLDTVPQKKAEYIIGFYKGWKLPHLEKEGGYAIIQYTDIDKIVYKHAKKSVKSYTKKEKQDIIEKLKLFVTTTQTNKYKLILIIAWSMSAIFRVPIMKFFKIFPHLYNYGERNAGKGSLEEFWIIHFYNFYKKLLPSKTIDSPSRLEDHLASSTAPIVVTEIDGYNIKKTISIIKEHATDITDFERKKDAKRLEYRKTKTTGLCLDSNVIVNALTDPATNTKMITNEFTKKDIPKIDFMWKKLFRELKKIKLFSFVYDATKDWDNKITFDIFNEIIEETKSKIKNYEEIERISPRILSIFQICLFGLHVWNLSFGFPLEEFLKIDFDQFLESLISGRKIIPRDLVDQFYRFCLTAKDFDEGYINDFGKSIKGDNPNHLQYPLELDKDIIYYVFTQNNLRDFNEYSKNYGKSNYNLKELANKIEDGLDDKEDITHSRCYPFSSKKQERVILIKKEWLK